MLEGKVRSFHDILKMDDKRGIVLRQLARTSAYNCCRQLLASVAQRRCFSKQFEQTLSCQPVTSTMSGTNLGTSFPQAILLALYARYSSLYG